MIFALLFTLVPLLATASSLSPSFNGKSSYYPKPSSWMLKPLPEGDEHYKPPRVASSSYVDSYSYWIVQAYYSSTGMYCNSDDLIMKFAIPTFVCMPTGEFTSMQYACWSVVECYFYEFQDSNCATVQDRYLLNLYMCQAGDADDDGYVTDDGNQFTSQQLIVQQGFPVPFPGNSTTLTTYNSLYCDQSSMSSYRLAYPNRCYNNFDGENRTSTQYLEPNLLSYNASGCDSSNIDGSVPYPPGLCQVDYTTSTSSMLVLNYPVIETVPIDLGTILGTTAGAFSAMAIVNTLLYFFQPALSEATQSSNMQAEKPSEF